jgi:hypothetical protein
VFISRKDSNVEWLHELGKVRRAEKVDNIIFVGAADKFACNIRCMTVKEKHTPCSHLTASSQLVEMLDLGERNVAIDVR